ncbi:hypothetical protein TNCV_3174001 [Trichonephila clavipes]|nr:hypothetical protein TNCV_3174001 [Trichonephila clavipes]
MFVQHLDQTLFGTPVVCVQDIFVKSEHLLIVAAPQHSEHSHTLLVGESEVQVLVLRKNRREDGMINIKDVMDQNLTLE